MAGRKAIEFDGRAFADLISLGCGAEEICWFFRDEKGKPANLQTLSNWCKRVYGMTFQEYRVANGAMRLKIQLRRNQLELSKKSASMAIFLGKNYLGQRDNVEIEDTRALEKLDIILAEMVKNAEADGEAE